MSSPYPLISPSSLVSLSPPINPSVQGRVLTSGQGPSRVTLLYVLQNYLTFRPHSFRRTPDDFLAFNPASTYHPSHSVFWRGMAILASIWILHAATPPFNLSPFIFFVGMSTDRVGALKMCEDISFIRAFAPKAAALLLSWDRLATFHVLDPSPSQQAARALPQHVMQDFRPYLDEMDVDLAPDLAEDLSDFKISRSEHSRLRRRLLNIFLFGHSNMDSSNPQFGAFGSGSLFFDRLRIFYLRQAFSDFRNLIFIIWRDVTIDGSEYLLERVRWLPAVGVPSEEWSDIKAALSRYIMRDGLPTLTHSAASEVLREVYASQEIEDAHPHSSSEWSRPHIRRLLLNRLVFGVEQPPGQDSILIELKPNRTRFRGPPQDSLPTEHTTLVARVCFSRLVVQYGTALRSSAVAQDDGDEFDRVMMACVLTSTTNFNTF
ncbi:hypothetical protein CALVIDRAFT_560279 [Calocera viscosa TUFC12733]|uniref:Uncharacterized protein n=1 Tax=Calocera viscosa (strain TUFC12733) TaxID=1330018 RepID=A0A167RJV2_CALVF|nr:hypothetical protein CALVIDRAFT_560279 [Calocera viscosa TUFC12733]